jgi:DnaK suppressor protein
LRGPSLVRGDIMDTKKLAEIRDRLSGDYQQLIKSINRNRNAAEEIRVEKTEDEGDLATISHDRDLLYNLHEGDYVRLRFIQQAIRAIDSGQYGECMRCGEAISARRLEAVPWATMCIHCQEEAEAEGIAADVTLATLEGEGPEF